MTEAVRHVKNLLLILNKANLTVTGNGEDYRDIGIAISTAERFVIETEKEIANEQISTSD